jgi:hypothetical protein
MLQHVVKLDGRSTLLLGHMLRLPVGGGKFHLQPSHGASGGAKRSAGEAQPQSAILPLRIGTA